jgi:predicted RNA-binding Zn-ribbon protein involved in translation (DUF1610 family)
MQQTKQVHLCPECGHSLKRTIGAVSRRKFWECTNCGFRKDRHASAS